MLLASLALLLALAYFSLSYYRNLQELAALKQEQKLSQDKARILRLIISTQQGEVKEIAQELEALKAWAKGVDELAEQVRDLTGLPKPTPTLPSQQETSNRTGFVLKTGCSGIRYGPATSGYTYAAEFRPQKSGKSLVGAIAEDTT
jgi:hypothetical protein